MISGIVKTSHNFELLWACGKSKLVMCTQCGMRDVVQDAGAVRTSECHPADRYKEPKIAGAGPPWRWDPFAGDFFRRKYLSDETEWMKFHEKYPHIKLEKIT